LVNGAKLRIFGARGKVCGANNVQQRAARCPYGRQVAGGEAVVRIFAACFSPGGDTQVSVNAAAGAGT